VLLGDFDSPHYQYNFALRLLLDMLRRVMRESHNTALYSYWSTVTARKLI